MAERRTSRALVAVAALAILVLLAAVVPSPFAIERPGPVVDALGSIDTGSGEVEVVRIAGADTFDTEGSLNVLSVSITGTPERPSSWLALAGALLDPTRDAVPLSELYPSGLGDEERRAMNDAAMRGSQLAATAAALGELGEPVAGSVRVSGIMPDGPAEGALREGDAILAVDDEPVSSIAELRAALADRGAGNAVAVGVERGGETLVVEVTPVASEDGAPVLGVLVADELEFPFEVELELDEIGGPSAGMIFALAVYEALTPGGLTGGLDVSGTGTIDTSGSVGPIGGLPQKLWAAAEAGTDLMLMPLANCEHLPRRLPEGLRIAPVETLSEAISVIETAAEGGSPPGLERCEASAGSGG